MPELTLTAPTTAILVVDMQNDNVLPNGAFASTGAAEHAASQDVIGHVRTILEAARAAGAPVFHNRIVSYPGVAVGGANAPIFTMIGPESLKRGTWGAEIIDGLTAGDEIVLDRTRMSAFNGTGLDSMLRNLGITTVVVVGVWTNMAVEHTVRDAADHGYRAVIVSDATSSINADWHAAALNYALQNIATITDTGAVVSALS
ncbi:gluconolactonase [Microbacterium phyllosphaerae]|uniref:Gluconolactonase n=1 Tax=Microbacterium phyllosphaerae TaxID=124798 RepID=A0ABS4WUQ2_9MICO|nr:cysteine hydrolase [Microbacterium phyllosphaerae]MBP2379876.1 gluconolactonase [Microbacterium phyllosphaerae]